MQLRNIDNALLQQGSDGAERLIDGHTDGGNVRRQLCVQNLHLLRCAASMALGKIDDKSGVIRPVLIDRRDI